MNTKIGTSQLSRSQGLERPDPTAVWAPLGPLSDAAVQLADGGAMVIARGFDRNSRERAKTLRDALEHRGVATIEVTQALGSERLLADTKVAGVLNLVGSSTWQPHRLAAKLRVPMLTPYGTAGDSDSEYRRDVIGVATEENRDIALSHVSVHPAGDAVSNLVITCGGEPVSLPGGWIAITPESDHLVVRFGGSDYAEQSLTATEVRVESSEGPHRLVRDELPIADFESAVTFRAEPEGLQVIHTA